MRTTSTIKLVSLMALAVTASLTFAQPAYAKAGHNQISPPVFDYTEPDSLYNKAERQQVTASEPSCYIEPAGFANQIHWDGACVEAMKKRAAARSASVNTQPQKFVEPRGFHNQIRWTD